MTLFPGDVLWADLGAGEGREPHGRRPVVVVSSNDYLRAVDSMVMVVPVTSRARGWPNHVPLTGTTGLTRECFAMTEQVRTIPRTRIVEPVSGGVDAECLAQIRRFLGYYLDI